MTADGASGGDALDEVDQADRMDGPAAAVGTGATGGANAASPTGGANAAGPTGGRARWGVFIGVAGAVIVIDQLSKAWLVANVAVGEVVSVIGDLLRFVQSPNSGALFGLFREQAILFALVSVAVVGLIALYHGRSGRSLYLSIALGLLLGGAIGNMIDRLRLGHVTDWIDMGLGTIRFWTYNVADSAITVAILMLLAMALFPALAGMSRGEADA
jgi:signal peptidase II